jgi:hypothetical protein
LNVISKLCNSCSRKLYVFMMPRPWIYVYNEM